MGNPIQSDKDAEKANQRTAVLVMSVLVISVAAAGLFYFLKLRTPVVPVKKRSASIKTATQTADDAFYRAKGMHGRGEHLRAAKLYTMAIRIKRENPKEGIVGLATILAWAGQNASQKNDYSEAILLFKQAIDLQYKKLGPKHEYIAMNLINLASAYHDQDNYADALKELERAMKMESVLSERIKADIHYWIGDNSQHLGNFQESVNHLKECIKIREKFGDKAPLASAMRKYASVLKKLKKDDEADKMEKAAEKLTGFSTKISDE